MKQIKKDRSLFCGKSLICLLFVLAFAACTVTFSACKKQEATNDFKDFITDSQKLKLEELAEAFAEGGYNFSTNEAITFMEMEHLVYFYFNDKLLESNAGEFASLDEDKADDFIMATFGVERNGLHYNFNESDDQVNFYFDKQTNKYMIRRAESYALSSEVISVEKVGERLKANISISCTDATECMISLTFVINDDSIKILECTRFDIA